MEIATPYCRMFEHAKFCCKICSANSHRRTEGMALLCDNKHAAGSRVRLKLVLDFAFIHLLTCKTFNSSIKLVSRHKTPKMENEC